MILAILTLLLVFGSARSSQRLEVVDDQPLVRIEADREDLHTSTHIYPSKRVFHVKDEYSELDKIFVWSTVRNISNPEAAARVSVLLDFQKITGENFDQVGSNTKGLMSADYRVHYDQNDIVSLSTTTQYYGAYPSEHTTQYAINTTTGESIQPIDIFRQEKMDDLLKILNQNLAQRIATAEQSVAGSPHCPDFVTSEVAAGKNFDPQYGTFSEDNLNFRITTNGIEFVYDFSFSHVGKVCEPESVISLNYFQLKEYIRPDGLLGHELK